jgi:serine/threonine-protein kinase
MLDPSATLPDPFPEEFMFRAWLGEGAYGQVWLADDLALHRQVAIKTLHPPGQKRIPENARDLFQREAQLLAQVTHPNIIQVYGWRSNDLGDFLILQYVPGGSLKDLLAHGPLGWARAGRYVADVAEGLLEVHRRGIVHRDIKPHNILLDAQRDEALLGDFGVANWLDRAQTAAGSMPYMAPEAFWGRASEASDVFSLAATLFQLAVGKLPFEVASQFETGLPDPDPRCAGLPAELERVIRAGLSRAADDRPTLQEFRDRLRGILNATLADTLTLPPGAASPAPAVKLRLCLVKPDGSHVPIATSYPPEDRCVRDMKKVPRPPERVVVRTGDRVRVEVEIARPGHVTVFNIGPGGALNLLYPDEPGRSPPLLHPGTPLHIVDVELTPPAGRERVFAIWTAVPLALRLDELRSLAPRSDDPVSRAYRASRDMVKVKKAVEGLSAGSWQVAVVEVQHVPC